MIAPPSPENAWWACSEWLQGDLRGIHFLASEHQLAQLKTNFAVVDDEGDLAYQFSPTHVSQLINQSVSSTDKRIQPSSLVPPLSSIQNPNQGSRKRSPHTLNKSNHLPSSATYFPKRIRHALRRTCNCRSSRTGNTRQALRGLGLVLGGSVLGRLGSLLCL